MICVGIDVAKDKHDCFILSSEGEVLADVFTIPNNAEGFDKLLRTIRGCTHPQDKIKVGLEAHIRHEHSCNSSRIDTVCLRFSKAEAFSVKVGVQRIDDIGRQTFVKQISENVVAVVSGSLKSYFYFVCRTSAAANSLQKRIKTFCIVWDGEYICQDFAF